MHTESQYGSQMISVNFILVGRGVGTAAVAKRGWGLYSVVLVTNGKMQVEVRKFRNTTDRLLLRCASCWRREGK